MKYYILLFLLLISISCGGSGGGGSSKNYQLIKEISGLAFPARLAELPNGKLLIAELANGNLSIYDRSNKKSSVIANFPINLNLGIGISGLLVDIDFNQNGYIYVYHGESKLNALTRLTLNSEKVSNKELLRHFGPVSGHNGGGMYQFNDGNILLGTGDSADPDSAQNVNSLNGKLILLSRNGIIINSNYSLGLRNPFGISGSDNELFVLDNGPTCDDEINLVSLNANYQWKNNYICGETTSKPLYRWAKSEGTTDLLYAKNSDFSGKLLAARYNTKTISVIDYNGEQTIEEQILFQNNDHGEFIDIYETSKSEILLASQDGNIYKISY